LAGRLSVLAVAFDDAADPAARAHDIRTFRGERQDQHSREGERGGTADAGGQETAPHPAPPLMDLEHGMSTK
jgi:hypothetical protein